MSTPLFTVEQLRNIERAAQVHLPAGELMRRAGASAAAAIDADSGGRAQTVLIVCGPGNNGGDGYVCALELAQRGHAVTCMALGKPATDDARTESARWKAAGGNPVNAIPAGHQFGTIVDAMFGIGLARPLSGDYLAAAQWMSAHRQRVFALDVPSGLDADRGAWVGDVPGVHARTTLTFLGAKPGLYTHDAVDATGDVRVDALGVELPPTRLALAAPEDFAAALAPRRRNSHKGSYGNVLVVGGNVGMVGAALIAARAALRLGTGRVYVDCIGARDVRLDPLQPELMFRRAEEITSPDAIVTGCGLGTDAAAVDALRAALARDVPLVLDADALNLIAAEASLRAALLRHAAPRVLTPHPLEAARLLGRSAAAVQSDRITAARTLADQLQSNIVLKGAGTVICDASNTWINPTGTPALASAGTGDALAGMIGALIAQGIAPEIATRAAVWLHGAAADEFTDEVGLAASDIAPRAAALLSRLRRSRGCG